MVETLEYIAADPKTRRAMQEEYWAALNDTILENQVTTLTNEKAILAGEKAELANENAELRRMLQQAGIEIPSIQKK